MSELRDVRRGRYVVYRYARRTRGRIDLETVRELAGSRAAISRAYVSEIDGVEGGQGKGRSRRNDRFGSWLRTTVAEGDMEE